MAESILTKQAIAGSLKELCSVKAFDKISIGELTKKCGINRQTFYYHFTDKYALLNWIYASDLLEPHMKDLNFNNWDERLRSLMEVMYKDKLFYMNTIKHAGSYIIQYMLNDTEMIITKAIDTIDQNSIVCDTERHFLSRFLSYGICGILTEWVTEGMQTGPKEMSAYMLKMLKHCENAAYDFKTGKLDI